MMNSLSTTLSSSSSTSSLSSYSPSSTSKCSLSKFLSSLLLLKQQQPQQQQQQQKQNQSLSLSSTTSIETTTTTTTSNPTTNMMTLISSSINDDDNDFHTNTNTSISLSLIFTFIIIIIIESLPLQQLWMKYFKYLIKLIRNNNDPNNRFKYSPLNIMRINLISLLIIPFLTIQIIDCQSSSSSLSSITPYRHGLARYYQTRSVPSSPMPAPPSSSSLASHTIINSYEIPSTLTSYSISLPLNTPIHYGPYTQSYYQQQHQQQQQRQRQQSKFQPQPQYCPETGRTVCSKVSYYPSDEVFLVVKMAKAKRFNISSEFVDESENDSEPYFEDDYSYDEFDNNNNNYYHPYAYSQPYFHPKAPPPPPPPSNYRYYNQQQPQPYQYRMNSVTINHEQPRHTHPSLVQHFHNLDWKNYRDLSAPNLFQIIKNGPRSISEMHNDYDNNNGSGGSGSSATTTPAMNVNSNNHYGSIKSPLSSSSYSTNHFNGGEHHHNNRQRFKRQTVDDVPITIEPLCPSRTILLEPKVALNDRRQWKYIVNLADRDRRLRQAIKVEVCMTPNAPCSNQISLPFGFVSKCRQKYIKKKLISLDESGQSISSENFFAPSCCVCEVSRGDPSSMQPPISDANINNNIDTSLASSSELSKRKRIKIDDNADNVLMMHQKSKQSNKNKAKQNKLDIDIDRPQSDSPVFVTKPTPQQQQIPSIPSPLPPPPSIPPSPTIKHHHRMDNGDDSRKTRKNNQNNFSLKRPVAAGGGIKI